MGGVFQGLATHWAAVRALTSPPLIILEQAKQLDAVHDLGHATLLELAMLRPRLQRLQYPLRRTKSGRP